MAEKSIDFEKYLSDLKWIDMIGFDFENENERNNFFYENGLAKKDDYIEMRLLDRGILGSVNDKRFKGVILIDGQNPDQAKAAGFAYNVTKGNFANSEDDEITPKDLQMLVGSLGGDFGLWCVFSPRQVESFGTVTLPDDEILKSRGGIM